MTIKSNLIPLPWIISPLGRSVILIIIFIMAFQGVQTLFSYTVLIAVLALIALVINIINWAVRLIIMVNKGLENKQLIKQLVQMCFVVAIPILFIMNVRAIEYSFTYMVVRIVEPKLLEEIQYSPGQLFRYGRFNFGKKKRLWVIYDESDQVLLAPNERSKEWWVTTNEDRDADNACFEEASRLYSHFFIRYIRFNTC